eukprot:1765596-Pyramimonas_sp.AAC.1
MQTYSDDVMRALETMYVSMRGYILVTYALYRPAIPWLEWVESTQAAILRHGRVDTSPCGSYVTESRIYAGPPRLLYNFLGWDGWRGWRGKCHVWDGL